MNVINIHQAKTHLSQYVADVVEGKEIIIGKYGQPLVKLVKFEPEAPRFKLGLLKNNLKISDEFDEAIR